MFQVCCAFAIGYFGPWRDLLALARAFVEARQLTFISAGINDVRIGWIGRNITRLATTYRIPIRTIDRPAVASARDRNRGVVLLRAIDVVRESIVRNDVI